MVVVVAAAAAAVVVVELEGDEIRTKAATREVIDSASGV